jgi:hypothetical protein
VADFAQAKRIPNRRGGRPGCTDWCENLHHQRDQNDRQKSLQALPHHKWTTPGDIGIQRPENANPASADFYAQKENIPAPSPQNNWCDKGFGEVPYYLRRSWVVHPMAGQFPTTSAIARNLNIRCRD